ncbi:hypothetical protein OF83DRAFT_422854 [Amylostereum chailletii]|nr:hypothetical protein OF83DRAFT_422854 [Amylostereum chailletii]
MTRASASASSAVQPRRVLPDNVAREHLPVRADDSDDFIFTTVTTTVTEQSVLPTTVTASVLNGSPILQDSTAIVTITATYTNTLAVSRPTQTPVPDNSSVPASSSVVSSSASPAPSISSTILSSPSSSPSSTPAASATGTAVANTSGGQSLADSNHANPASKRLPSGALVGIIIGVVVLIALVCLFIFRKTQIDKRKRSRATWKAGIRAKSSDFANMEKGIEPPAPLSPFMLGMPGAQGRDRRSIFSIPSEFMTAPSPAYQSDASPLPPHAAFSASMPNWTSTRSPSRSPSRTPSRTPSHSPSRNPSRTSRPGSPSRTPLSPEMAYSPASIVARPTTAAPVAVVRVTFIPTLNDELAIAPGESLRVLGSFDDGWAMCTNARGERGMVPLECLEGAGGQFRGFEERRTTMASARRASSLYPMSATRSPWRA